MKADFLMRDRELVIATFIHQVFLTALENSPQLLFTLAY